MAEQALDPTSESNSNSTFMQPDAMIYQGQFGEFTITDEDRKEVTIYRGGLMVAALCFALGSGLALWQGASPLALNLITLLYGCFWMALGVSLFTIHIYLRPLHQALQAFWAIGGVASVAISLLSSEPLALTLYHYPFTILGIGFTFAALNGIFFKEAFCFNRLETKILTPIVPLLLLGHMTGILPAAVERSLLMAWVIFFLVFALRKVFQARPDDIGDKSVFAYLKQQREAATAQ